MLYRIPEEFHAVDAHNHVWLKDGRLDENRMRDMLAAAETLGIEKICVSTPLLSPAPSADEVRAANDAVLRAMRLDGRLLGFCFVDAALGAQAVAEIDRCVIAHGMCGIKLYHQHKLQDRVQDPVMRRAAELGIPVLMHAGCYRNADTLARGPLTSHAGDFLEALEVWPETMFIEAHIGGGGDWQWILRTLEEVRSDNFWIDISGTVHDAGIVRATIDAVGIDRVLFATDGSFETSVAKLLAAGLDREAMLKITSGNFARIMARRNREVKHV